MTDEIKELELHIWPEKGEKWLFNDQYLIPLYQRPYTWSKNEISRLLDDIKGIDSNHSDCYRLGVLSVIAKEEPGKKKYEVIDGQQRLTTLYLLLKALSDPNLLKDNKEVFEGAKELFEGAKENLIFENRENSTDTLKNPEKEGSGKDVDPGIHAGFKGICDWIKEHKKEMGNFLECLKKVSVYRVPLPKNTDPCKYFVRMNDRGKQLEPADVIKARLMSCLKEEKEDRKFFKYIWEACSRMDRYIQKTIDTEFCDEIFKNWKDGLPWTSKQKENLEEVTNRDVNSANDDANKKSIINFPTFLMHVLKLCALNNNNEVVAATDDKKLIKYFEDNWGKDNREKDNRGGAFNNPFRDRTSIEVREFLYTLFRARYLFDGWIVRGEQEDETGWVIQHLKKVKENLEPEGSFELPNEKGLRKYEKTSEKIKMLQSCLRVTYSSPSSMPWITELLKKLWDLSYGNNKSDGNNNPDSQGEDVLKFLEKYSCERVEEELKDIKEHEKVSKDHIPSAETDRVKDYKELSEGTATPRILFNFLDYLLWRKQRDWFDELPEKEKNIVKKGLNNFKFSYLSSVEHWYPQNPSSSRVPKWDSLFDNGKREIDQFGNLFLIGGGENSSLSNGLLEDKKGKIEEWVNDKNNISLKGLYMYAKTVNEEKWREADCFALGENHFEMLRKEVEDKLHPENMP